MSLTNEVRTEILKAIQARILLVWGPSATVPLLRGVRRGQWRVGSQQAPSVTVVDGGGRAGSEAAGDLSASSKVIAIQIVLDLAANWDADSGGDAWIDFIALLIGDLTNLRPADCGVLRIDYQDDDIWTAQLQAGKTAEVWIVNFECEYMTEDNVATVASP